MSPSTHAMQKYFMPPGSSLPHGNQTTAGKAGRVFLVLTSNGDTASLLTLKTPRKFILQPLAGASGMGPWMEKIVHWTSLRLSFSLDDREQTFWRERDITKREP